LVLVGGARYLGARRTTGRRLFGYRTAPRPNGAEWVVFEPEAEIVRHIFRLYLDGLSMKAIAVRLTRKASRSPRKRRDGALNNAAGDHDDARIGKSGMRHLVLGK
jgi:Recombinase